MTERSIRDIVLAIEARMPSPQSGRRMTYPRRLSARQQDALELALCELSKPFSYRELIDEMNRHDAGCITKGGETNDNLRAALAEMQGLAVRYAQPKRREAEV